MLYREYRPQKFSDLINAEHIVSVLTTALSKDSVPHAYFFTGSRGIGKTTTARILAKSLNCKNPVLNISDKVKFEPCGECDVCTAVEQGRYLDLIEIDAASNRGIDNIRELIDKVKLSPSMGKNKIYIIDEVHMLTTEASNALLKTLEEPPKHAYFILCTTNPEKVLDTIKSRCLQFVFKRPSISNITAKLKKIAEDKNFEADGKHLEKIAHEAKGAYRDAETLFEQYIESGFEAGDPSGSGSNTYSEFIGYLESKNSKNALEYILGLSETEVSLEAWAEKFISFLRSSILIKAGVSKDSLDVMFDDSDFASISNISLFNLKDYLHRFSKAYEEFRVTPIESLPLELAVLDLTSTKETDEPEAEKPPVKPVKVSPLSVDLKVTAPLKVEPISIVEKDLSKNLKKDVKKDIVEELPKVVVSSKPVLKEFPLKVLQNKLKEENHSIYLLMGTCRVVGFDGKTVVFGVPYSFHKERLMSNKIRTIVETSIETITGHKILVSCDLISKNAKAESLTDRNIKSTSVGASGDLENIFEEVFGDDIKSND